MKRTRKKYYINFKKVKRNILIILFIITFIKYCNIINSYNKKVLATYDDYLTFCENQNIKVSQEDYKNYIK